MASAGLSGLIVGSVFFDGLIVLSGFIGLSDFLAFAGLRVFGEEISEISISYLSPATDPSAHSLCRQSLVQRSSLSSWTVTSAR